MPVILEIGDRAAGPMTTADHPLDVHRTSPDPIWVLELPGLYGLEPLNRIAAGLALHGECPAPLPSGGMEWDLIVEAMDLEPEPFPMMVHPESVYVSDPSLFDPERVGDLRGLRDEVRAILEDLSGPYNLAEALAVIGSEPYALEWYLGSALRLACEVALTLDLPLSFHWRFPLKAPTTLFGYRDAFFWGLSQLTEATLEEQGTEIKVRFVGGYQYRIPLDYLVTWHLEAPLREGVKAIDSRVAGDGNLVVIRLVDGEEQEFTDVAILAGCEPYYEHFGGWTEEAKANVQRGFERWGPFRLEPAE